MGYKAWPPNRGMRVKEREHMVRKQVNRKFGGESGSATRGGSGVWGRLVIACTKWSSSVFCTQLCSFHICLYGLFPSFSPLSYADIPDRHFILSPTIRLIYDSVFTLAVFWSSGVRATNEGGVHTGGRHTARAWVVKAAPPCR